jgi:Glycosyl hydrolase family 26
MIVFKITELNSRKRAIAISSSVLYSFLLLIILNLNVNFLSLHGHMLAQAIKIGDYNDTLKKQQIQTQLSLISNSEKATNPDTRIYSTQWLRNGIIQGAMTDPSGNEDGNADLVNSFNNLAGKKIGVAYFSDNWFQGIHFPLDKCVSIRTTGVVPFIRIQNWIREGDKLSDAGPYTHKNIAAGMFDTALRDYAQAAKSFGTTLLIEYGVEINGNWFPWSQEGPRPYKVAYRHIVNLFREEGATNVRWAFHVDATDNDNGFKWYPGDDIIDWVGTSCYGASGYGQQGCITELNRIYDNFSTISKTKPLGIFEWGIGDPADTANVLHTIATDPKFSRIKLLQVWNEGVVPGHPEDLVPDGRINATPENLKAYRNGIDNPAYVSVYHD